MKFRNNLLPLLVISVNLSAYCPAATNRYWNFESIGGDGVWGTDPGTKNWNASPGAASGNITWPDPVIDDVAVFQDSLGGTVTVFDPVQTSGISQTGADYTLNSSTITLVPDSAANAPFVNVQSGTLTANSEIAGTHGLLKTGAGNLVLSNVNPYTGTTAVSEGALTLSGSLSSATISISSGANLLNQSGGLDSAAVVTNAGFLTVNSVDTITSLTNNSGTVNGTGNLTVTGSTLFNGGTLDAPLVINGNGGGTFTNATIAGTFNGTTSLDGGTVSGTVNGNTTSTGNVLVSGMIGGGRLDVTGGTLSLTGTSTNHSITIEAPGKLIDTNGGLIFDSNIINRGILTINATEAIGHLTNLAGTVDGTGTLDVGSATFEGGTLAAPLTVNNPAGTSTFANASIAGTFHGDRVVLDQSTVSGTVTGNHTSIHRGALISGLIGGGMLNMTGGTVELTGSSTNSEVFISASATLIDFNGGLDPGAALTNEGSLAVNTADTIASYESNGGSLLAGPGVLSVTTANLNDGSSVAGLLEAGLLSSAGAVSITGTASAGDFNIASGSLTNTGMLSASTRLNIAAGATLVASGTQNYPLLTTSGAGTGTWQGNLTNPTTVAPGGIGDTGTLAVTGNFTNATTGTIRFDLATAVHDLVTVGGTATFAGALDLNQLAAPAPFVPVQIVAASSYSGNFTSLTENLDGIVWFNPGNGSVTRLAFPSGGTLYGTSANQTSTWISLYDDVIDPGTTNINRDSNGNLTITSGLADSNNPDLLWALAASFTPSGLDETLLNRLSPEVYRGFQDYAIQSTRSHQRAALAAPALGWRAPQRSGSKDSAKDTLPVRPSSMDWELFAALDGFTVETDNSLDHADYQAEAIGFIIGTRTMVTDRVRIGGYFAGNDGSVEGALIDADAAGWSVGMFTDALLEEKSHTLLSAGFSYGDYYFDGDRDSISATGSGWSPGLSSFDDVNSDALEFFIGLRSLAWHSNRFRFIPSAGFRYVTGSMSRFAENSSSTAGGPIALAVEENHYHAAMAELGIRAEADLTSELTIRGMLGCSVDLLNDTEVLSARFAKGIRPMNADAQGLSDDVLFIGLGTTYQFSENIAVGLDWRAEIRSGADVRNGFNLTSTFRF